MWALRRATGTDANGDDHDDLLAAVREYWEAEPCGTRDLSREDRRAFFARLERERYEREPHIPSFAGFASSRDLDVLEIGVGAGTDFVQWVRAGARAKGIDLTEAAIGLTRERLELEGRQADLSVGNAEHLPFADASFDIVYSYGVLHHAPHTVRAISEVHRVLRPGGVARVMLYRVPSLAGYILWGLHSAAKLRPWESVKSAIASNLQSPGAKAFTRAEVQTMFADFASVHCEPALLPGDLLLMPPRDRYRAPIYRAIWRAYPRRLIKLMGRRLGFGMLIEARH